MTWHSDNLHIPEGRCAHGLIQAVCRLCPLDPPPTPGQKVWRYTAADPLQLDWDAPGTVWTERQNHSVAPSPWPRRIAAAAVLLALGALLGWALGGGYRG